VWGLWRDEGGFVLAGLRAAGPLRISARALIVCAGATSLPGGRYVPVTEPTRLLWAAHRFDPISAAWLPDIDPSGRTTVAHLYAAGACADPGGDAALQGRRAARAALDDFVMPVGARPVAALDDTILCACEGVTTAMARAAMAAGAGDPNQVKAFTRAGMGTCQGRLCGDALGRLFAAPPPLTARLPLRPVPMEAVLGRFTYADIPVPVAAPI
jgi:bacterioferritin-associated ferredoxin